MIDEFLNKVSCTIEKFNMFSKSERLLVCLSGGADSVSLLLCLKSLGYELCACHVNHQLRGEESERDQKFCEKLCADLGVELHTFRIDVRSYCKENSLSIEEGAREMRYRIFADIACDKICTAHSLSDRLETTVFNLARGTGLKGLCSIPPKRDNIVRPLIECSRQEISDYLDRIGAEYVTDSTNLTDEYTRNRIRHNVVPQLELINPSLMKSFAMTLEHIRKDEEFLEKTAECGYTKCCQDGALVKQQLCELDECIRDRVLMLWFRDNELTVSHEMLELAVKTIRQDGKLNVSAGNYLVCSGGKVRISSCENTARDLGVLNIEKDGEYIYGSKKIIFKTQIVTDDTDLANVHKMFANCCLDCDKIKGGLVLHKRSPGDTIRLVNRGFSSPVRKLVNSAFAAENRDDAVILYDSEGVVFVESFGVDERVKITSNTRRILSFEINNII